LQALLGRRQLRLHLDRVGAGATTRMAEFGPLHREPEHGRYLLDLADGLDPDAAVPELVRDLVALGVRVHAVEPARISLEEKLLDVLRGKDQEA